MDLKEKRQAWNEFFTQTKLGKAVIEAEVNQLEPFLQNFVGYDFLQLTSMDRQNFFFAPRVKNTYFIADEFKSGLNYSSLIGAPTALPFAKDSIDLVFIHHLLEWHSSPSAILKEAVRIVHPQGYLLVAIFRPLSFWQFNALFRNSREVSLSKTKILNWLELLEIEVVNTKRIFTALPVNNARALNFFARLNSDYLDKFGINFFGNIDLIWLQKQIGCTTFQPHKKPVQILNNKIGLTNVKASSKFNRTDKER